MGTKSRLKNVVYGKSLKKYLKKYGKRKGVLLSFTEEEIRRYNSENKPEDYYYILQGRRWWYIKGTYYEVGRGINTKGLKVALPILLGGGAAAGVTIGVVNFVKNIDHGEIIEKKYKVTYDANGGIIGGEASKVIEENETIQVAPNATREGWLLEGWYKTNECKAQDKATFPYKITGDTTLYAKWVEESKSGTLTITFNSGTGGTNVLPMQVAKGSKFSDYGNLITPSKENYKFKGWSYKEDEYDPVDLNKTIDSAMTLYAFYDQSAFELKLETDGAQPANTEDLGGGVYLYNKKLKTLNVEPQSYLENSGLLGWKVDGEGDYITYPYTLTKDTTLKALYQKGAVTYNAAFYDVEESPYSTQNNVVQISTAPTEKQLLDDKPGEHNGQKFVGWRDRSTGKIANFSTSGGYILNSNAQFDAEWKDCEFKVKFYVVKGTEVEADPRETRDKCGLIGKKPKYVVDDYELEEYEDGSGGWYNNPQCTGDPIDFTNGYEITKDTSLYGKYNKSNYSVEVYGEDGKSLIGSFSHCSKLIKTDLPTISKTNNRLDWQYYKKSADKWVAFDWENEPTVFISKYMGESDEPFKIKAKFTPVAFYLTLNYPSSLGIAPIKLSEQLNVKLSDLKSYKYIFEDKECIGWSRTDGGEIIDEEKEPEIKLIEDTNFYAKYDTRTFNYTIDYLAPDKSTPIADRLASTVKYGEHDLTTFNAEKYISKNGINYIFSHWELDGKTVIGKIKVDKTINLKAIYSTRHDVKISYRYYEDSKWIYVTPKTYTGLSSITYNDAVSSIPSKENFVLEEEPKWQYRITTSPDTLYAINEDNFDVTQDNIEIVFTYIHNSFTASFQNSDGSDACTPLTIKKGSVLKSTNIPSNPTKKETGENLFNGWGLYEGSTIEGDPIDFDTGYVITTAKDLVFRPIFDRTMEVEFSVENYSGKIQFKNDSGETAEKVTIKTAEKIESNSFTKGKWEIEYIDPTYHFNCWLDELNNKVKFPVTDGKVATKKFHAVCDKDASYCTVLLNAGEGQFDTSGTKELMLKPAINSTLGDMIKNPTTSGYKQPNYTDHKLTKWKIYDQSTQSYEEIDNSYKFTSNVFLYPEFEEDVDTEEKVAAKGKFANDNWATISYWADQGESKFQQHYKNDFASTSNIVGTKKNVTINNKSYEAIILGKNEDKTDYDTTAVLTFGLLNTPIASIYNPSLYGGKSNNWDGSLIRNRLSEYGEFYDMIDPVLSNHVLRVNKNTRMGQNDSKTYNDIQTTQDQYFLFSATELGINTTTYKDYLDGINEGTKYTYFNKSGVSLKRSLNGTTSQYWLRSPINHAYGWINNSEWDGVLGSGVNWITTDGKLKQKDRKDDRSSPSWEYSFCYYADVEKAIIFGFCIGDYRS